LVDVYSIAVARHALTQRSKGQDHTVTKTVTVARLLVMRAATAYAGVGTHVDSTAYVF